MNEEFYEALERFSIMTEQTDGNEIAALKHIQEVYGREMAVKVWEEYCKK